MPWTFYTASGQQKQAVSGGPGLFVLDDLTVTGSALASYDTQTRSITIPQTYKELRLSVVARSTDAAANVGLSIQFNGDTAANYDWNRVVGQAATASAAETIGASNIGVGLMAAGGASSAQKAGICEIYIPEYAGTTWHKMAYGKSFTMWGTTTGSNWVAGYGGIWKSTSAITRITAFPSAGSFAIGTRLTLYGVN